MGQDSRHKLKLPWQISSCGHPKHNVLCQRNKMLQRKCIYSWHGLMTRSGRGTVLVVYGFHNKVPQTGLLKNRNLFSFSSGCQKSEIKVSTGLVSSVASLFELQVPVFSLCLTWSSLCVQISST